jgi:hypothetical protein
VRGIFQRVSRQPFRFIIHVLIAAQLLLSAPIYAVPAAADQDCCPCCPDGAQGVAACLSACTASVGAISTFAPYSVALIATAAPPGPRTRGVAEIADPPLKPPPIV